MVPHFLLEHHNDNRSPPSTDTAKSQLTNLPPSTCRAVEQQQPTERRGVIVSRNLEVEGTVHSSTRQE